MGKGNKTKMNYEDEEQERLDKEKNLDGYGLEYLHCSDAAYIYVEGKIVYDISKSDMVPTGGYEIFFPMNQWCDARWFANKLSQSCKLWKYDDLHGNKKGEKE
jgi:hypothetical protein